MRENLIHPSLPNRSTMREKRHNKEKVTKMANECDHEIEINTVAILDREANRYYAPARCLKCGLETRSYASEPAITEVKTEKFKAKKLAKEGKNDA